MDHFDWLLWQGATPSLNTGPSKDHSGRELKEPPNQFFCCCGCCFFVLFFFFNIMKQKYDRDTIQICNQTALSEETLDNRLTSDAYM